jgi:hypothetical protein
MGGSNNRMRPGGQPRGGPLFGGPLSRPPQLAGQPPAPQPRGGPLFGGPLSRPPQLAGQPPAPQPRGGRLFGGPLSRPQPMANQQQPKTDLIPLIPNPEMAPMTNQPLGNLK